MTIWPVDPKDQKRSVSLGILIIATIAMATAVGMQLTGNAKDVSLVTEWWYGSAGLYFGRRMAWGKGNISGVADGDSKNA